MPWSTVPDHPECPAETPWAVVNDETGEKVACHATEDDANAQVAALYANVEEEIEGEAAADPVLAAVYDAWGSSPANPGAVTAADGAPFDPALYAQGYCRGVLAVEDVPTGDSPRRRFAPDSLTFREPPLSLYWQKVTADGHDNAFIVARADDIWRADDIPTRDGRLVSGLRFLGAFNMRQPEGVEAHQLVGDGFLHGVSVTVSETQESDVEYVFPEGVGPDDMVMPDEVVLHRAEAIDGCLTGQPALVDCFIELVSDESWASQTAEWVPPGAEGGPAAIQSGESLGEAAEEPVVALRAVPAHESAVEAGTWSVAGNLGRLPESLPAAVAASAFAWLPDPDAETVPSAAGRFLHHAVNHRGRPGGVNLTACVASIAQLNGGRGGPDIPVEDREGVYAHLAAHLRAAGREPPPLLPVEGAAAMAALTEELEPPRGLVVVARPADPASLVVERGLPAEELHVTVGYYGNADEAAPELLEALHAWAAEQAEFAAVANVGGVARMGDDDPPATALLIECAELAALRTSLEAVAPPDAKHPHFTPHITLGYGVEAPAKMPKEVALSGVELWAGGEHYLGGEALTAACSPPERPPLAWFQNQKLRGPTPATYLDSGQCFGYLATWGTCHLSFAPNVCVTPPRGGDYSGFRVGTVTCDDGTEVATGVLTLGTLHAPAQLGFGPAKHHYEHTGHGVADVAIGEDKIGIWFAGALRPDVGERQLRVLRASGVSGDWRRQSNRGGWRLAGALVVNVPGFPVPRTVAYTRDGEQTALVAAGVLTQAPTNVVPIGVADRIARSVGLDHPSRRARARARVFGKEN